MFFDVASRPPRGGPEPPDRERIPSECAAGRPLPSSRPLLTRYISRGLQAQACARVPTSFPTCGRGGAEGGGRPRVGRPRRRPLEEAGRLYPCALRERKRLNEEQRGGSGAPGEEAAGWEQTLASREPGAERRGREGGGGARGALTCPFLSSLSGKHERADLPLRRPPGLLASPSSGSPSPVRVENARREDGGRPEEPPGLQFLCAPER